MTLGRRGREPAEHADSGDPISRAVELEELPPQRLTAATRPRVHPAPLVVVAGVAGLLAVGLGVFGGRETARMPVGSFVPSAGAATSPATPNVALATPAVPCQPSTESVPRAFLDVDGSGTPAVFDEMEFGGHVAEDARPPDFGDVPDSRRTEIPSDAQVSIRIEDDACAVGWSIDLTDANQSINLVRVVNEARDPLVAQQNRFDLPVARFRGADFNLVAQLAYADVVRRAIWPIRILPFELPMASLQTRHHSIAVNAGCDVQLSLRNGEGDVLGACNGSVASAPPLTRVHTGAPLTFSVSEGWTLEIAAIACGQLSGHEFVAESDCEIPFEVADQSATFEASPVPGTWTVGIAACAVQPFGAAQNALCGTWYATVRVVQP